MKKYTKFAFKKIDTYPLYIVPLFLFIIASLPRILLLHTEYLRTVDSIEYINVARNFAQGHGFTATVKPFLSTGFPVIYYGNLLRPMVTPLVYALLLKIYDNNDFLQFFNLFLSAVNVVVFYYLAKFFLSQKNAIVAALLIAFNPFLIIDSRFIISEQLFYLSVLTFFIVYYYLPDKPTKYVYLGIIAAISFLTRTEGLMLLIIACIFSIRKPLFIGIALFTFFLVCLPNTILTYKATGDIFFSPYSYQLRVISYNVVQQQFYHGLPSPFDFVLHKYVPITKAIMKITIGSLETLLGFRFLGILTIAAIGAMFRVKKFPNKNVFPIVIFIVLMYIIETFTWAVAFQPERHLAIVFFFLILLIFIFAKNILSTKLLYTFCAITLLVYSIFDIHQFVWIRTNSAVTTVPENDRSISWIKTHTNTNVVFATYEPLMLYLFSGRPAVMLPSDFPTKDHNLEEFLQYLKQYNVSYIKVYESNTDLYNYLTKEKFKKVFSDGNDAIFCTSSCNE